AETSTVGTLKAIPVSFPFSSGITLVTAVAAPVLAGIILFKAERPPLKSFLDGPSTTICDAVAACTVVIKASTIPNSSCNTFAKGAKQLVVQEAFDMIVS